jgi:hypothetical protein
MMPRRITPLVAAAVLLAACQEQNAGVMAGPSPAAVQGEAIFADDFESGTLAAWQDGVDPSRHHVVTEPAGAQSGTHYLAVAYPPGRDGGWLTRFLMPGYDALSVSYYVRFPSAWVGSTKLLALYGSRTDDPWSAFGKAGLCPRGNDFFAAMMVAEAGRDPGPARFYDYYPAMRREPDGTTCWGRLGDGSETYDPAAMSRGVWHRIEFVVTLNTPGRADARQDFWIDGVKRGSWPGVSFRDSDILRLNAAQLTFSAALESQPRELHVDNVLVRAVGRQ